MTEIDPARGVVLVVDDEPGVRKLARRILERAGYGVVEAEHGAAALAVIDSATRVDFLMADLDMPVMRGEEMAKRIRAKRPDLKVLYVTAHVDSLFADRPQLWEGEAFLDKPFSVDGLLQAISLLQTGSIHEPAPQRASSFRRIFERLRGGQAGRDIT